MERTMGLDSVGEDARKSDRGSCRLSQIKPC